MIADLFASSPFRILVVTSFTVLCSCDTDSVPSGSETASRPADPAVTVDDTTAYPLELPGWYEELWAKLEQPVDISLPRVPLSEALRTLEALTQVSIRADESARATTSTRVTLSRLVGIGLERVLKYVVMNVHSGLEIRPTPRGLVVTLQPEEYPQPEAAAIRRKLKRLRDTRAKTERRDSEEPDSESIRRFEHRLQTTRLTVDFADRPITEVVGFLEQVLGINLILDSELDTDAITVSVTAEDETADAVLDRLLETKGLGRVHDEGILLILDRDKAKQHRLKKGVKRIRQRQKLLKIQRLLEKKLEPSFEGRTAREASVALSKALGVPVHLDPESWRSEVRITDLSSPTDLDEIGEILESRGLRMIVEEDAVYVVSGGE